MQNTAGCTTTRQETDGSGVRTKGNREYTCSKTGKAKVRHDNVYIHFLLKCLKGYDAKFSFAAVTALKATIEKLPKDAMKRLEDYKIKAE